MRCKKCGAELRDDVDYCYNCGSPVRLAPDYSSLESVLAGSVNDIMLEDEDDLEFDINTGERKKNNLSVHDKKDKELKEALKEKQEKRKKKRKIAMLCSVLGVVILLGIVSALFITSNSYSYQMYMGNKKVESKEYSTALKYFKRAVNLNSQKAAPLDGEGRAYFGLKDYDNAIAVLKEGIDVEENYPNTYLTLCKVYETKGDLDSITDIFEDVDNEKVFEKCEGYYCAMPKVSLKSGNYNVEKKVALKSTTGGNIYYTLDGSEPNEKSEKYKEGIEFNRDGEYFLQAVCINEKGIRSLVAREDFKFDLPIIESPGITPDTGLYTSDITIEVTVPENCTVYYTWDGKEPTSKSAMYSTPIILNKELIKADKLNADNITFYAVAIDNNTKRPSSVTKRNYQMVYIESNDSLKNKQTNTNDANGINANNGLKTNISNQNTSSY